MLSATLYTKTGSKSSTKAKLDSSIFSETIKNHDLLKLAYDVHLANGRQNLAYTKTRGEVRGGGRKPWVQKGTGRARAGTIRSPIWRGGGITFGPRGENHYQKKLSQSAKHKAIRQALSLSASGGTLKIIEDFNVKSGRTKDALSLLNKLGCAGRTVIAVESIHVNTRRALQNIPNIKLLSVKYLSVYDILNSEGIIITNGSLEVLKQWLSPAKSQDKKL